MAIIDAFTNTGGFTWNNPGGITEVEVLVVAGRDGGGSFDVVPTLDDLPEGGA